MTADLNACVDNDIFVKAAEKLGWVVVGGDLIYTPDSNAFLSHELDGQQLIMLAILPVMGWGIIAVEGYGYAVVVMQDGMRSYNWPEDAEDFIVPPDEDSHNLEDLPLAVATRFVEGR